MPLRNSRRFRNLCAMWPSKDDTRRTMTNSKPWTDDEVRKLRDLREKNVKTSDIARQMGRTVESVSRKSRRIKSPDDPKKLSPTPESEIKKALEPGKIKVQALPPKRHIETCQWPIGTPRTPGFRFCEDDLKSGSRYCAKHHAKAYVPMRSKVG
jgi:hypothetical protein